MTISIFPLEKNNDVYTDETLEGEPLTQEELNDLLGESVLEPLPEENSEELPHYDLDDLYG